MLLDTFERTYKLIMEESAEAWRDRNMWGKDKGDYSPEQAAEDFIKTYNLKLNESTGRYDCDGDMSEIKDPKDRYYDGWQIPVPLGVVKGNFTNVRYSNIPADAWNRDRIFTWDSCTFKSFKNFPTRVEGNFVCSVSNRFKATDMTGMPEYVGGDFILDGARYLKTMQGAPKHVGGNFVCSHCYSLTDCVGAPQDIGEGVDLTWNYRLSSLKGLPKVINGDLICDKCKSLSTFEGAPEKVTGKIKLAGMIPRAEMNAWKLKVTGKSLRQQEKRYGMHRNEGKAMARGATAHNYYTDSHHEKPLYTDKIRGESREVRRHKRVVK